MKNRRILVLILIFILLFSVVSNAMSFVDNTANNTGFHEITKDFPDTYADIVDKPYIVRAVYNKKTSKYEQYHWFFAVSDSAFFYYKNNSIWFDNGSGGGYINFIAYNVLNNSFSLQRNSPISATGIFAEDSNNIVELVYYGTDIWTNNNKTELWFNYNPVELPYFLNTAEDLENLGSPTIIIDPGTADIEPGYFDFFVDTGAISQETTTIFSVKLDSSSPYYHTGRF